jgi:hypothetical protein
MKTEFMQNKTNAFTIGRENGKRIAGACFLRLLICGMISSAWAAPISKAAAAQPKVPAYKIKAIYLHKFLLFAHWPEPKAQQSSITIGIVGEDPFESYFDEVEGKTIPLEKGGRKLVIKRFGPFHSRVNLKQCHMLFISQSERKNISKILASIKGTPILTFSDTKNFLKMGGMVNFVQVKDSIRWEINQTPIKRAGLRLDSQILRLAVRIVSIPKSPNK